jgi:dTDP-4-dehydrorhamnose reductase
VHVSTDYVFDGSKRAPWVESDAVGPIGAYGRSKLAGEQEIAAASEDHAIVRTAWLFGAGGRNFVDSILALGRERDELEVVADQVGSPTWSAHLAEALVELAERGEDVGIFHAAGAGACSWYELAVEALDRAGVRCRVRPTTAERYARPAPRPAYSVLGTERRDAPVLPAWQDGVAGYLAEKAVVAG